MSPRADVHARFHRRGHAQKIDAGGGGYLVASKLLSPTVGMVSGFCGTLMTPMAANFNIVPAALLELPNENAVIKVQIPTGLMLLAANTLIMYVFVFR